MALIVQKYGGTSVGDVERIKNVARRCIAAQKAGNDVVVVVSAMSGETNKLLKLVSQITDRPNEREQDVVAATGEQVTIVLVSLAIQAHTKKAAVAGASDEEIAETTFVAMAMAAGAAWSHGGLALQCLQEHKASGRQT